VVTGFAMNWIFQKLISNPKIYNIFIILMQIICGIAILVYIIINTDIVAKNSYFNRTFNIMIVFAFSCILFIMIVAKVKYPSSIFKYITSFMIITAVCISTVPRINYANYLQQVNTISQSKQGFISLEDTDLMDNPKNFNWSWTTPSESLIAQGIYGESKHISGIVVQPAHRIGWEPFDSYDIHSYPDLSDYGISYDKNSFPGRPVD